MNARSNLATLEKARWFARYSYAPEPNWEVLELLAGEAFSEKKEQAAKASDDELMDLASAVADKVFEGTFSALNGDFVIPLSGGRDSRFLLAMAIEMGLKDRVVAAFTFGAPGGLEQEIASKTARHFGVRHHFLDILAHRVTWKGLRHAFENGAQWTDLVLAHVGQAWRNVAPQAVSGYLGDAAGSHYEAGSEHYSLAEAKHAFDRVNLKFPSKRGHIDLIGDIADRLLPPNVLNIPEQLDLVYRQEGFIRRIVASPQTNVRTPLAHPEWIRFMYALPGRCRLDSKLYVEFLRRRFPKAFAIPTSNSYGLRDDASRLAVKASRTWRRGVEESFNALGLYGRASIWKYGDPRRLCAALDLSDAPPARSLARLERTRLSHKSKREASGWRQRAMLRCNLLLDSANGVERARSAADALA